MTADHDRRVTTCVLTHYDPHEHYGDLSPPAAGIVSETVDSATTRITGLTDDDVDIFYFRPHEPSADSRTYYDNLKRLAEDSGLTLYAGVNDGLRLNLAKILERVDTPYLFFIEHDWRFVEDAHLSEILDAMDRNADINNVRFNKYQNRVEGWNTVVEPDPTLSVPMCRVASFTNQPHISRTEKLEEWVDSSEPSLSNVVRGLRRDPHPEKLSYRDLVKIFRDRYVEKKVHGYKINGVEYFVDTNYKRMIKREGFRDSHAEYGTYLYGPHGSGPYVEHLGR